MEAFSLLKFWRIADGDDADFLTNSSETAAANDGRNQAAETDDEEDFFDLEFNAPGCDEGPCHNFAKNDGKTWSDFVESPGDLPLESNSKPQSPISFFRSPPRLRVFMLMLFKKPKSEKTEINGVSSATPKRFSVKCKVEEVPILSFLARVNSSRSKLQRQSSEDASSRRLAKDVVQKYLNMIKPLYVRASKRYGENLKFSDRFSPASPSSSPARLPDEKQGSRAAPLRVVCRHLGKSRSVSSAAGILPAPVSKRDDSLLQQHDGIQSAILHCKSSYNSTRDFSVPSRFASEPNHEISVDPRNSTEKMKRTII
ncbi:Membrane-associated kinase regulator [Actinidia chinensis var. chinensis]|uniref:Membrane-associated kinase regulator n=1 Tax=Actinidia chinensis var. chinensis TaxID=1590841 RepID=A0A2R6Q933_ACTCC|nr:Membrane-associated kinase regulator [Actinidia chinensis var. chinensis]